MDWSAWIFIVSLVPPFAWRYKAFAASSVEVKLIDDDVVISISSPALPEEVISIPPALALKTIASATFSVDEIFTEPPVFAISISLVPPVDNKSISRAV